MSEVRGSSRGKREYERNGRSFVAFTATIDYGYDDFGKRDRDRKEFKTAAARDEWFYAALANAHERTRGERSRGKGPSVGDILETWYADGVASGWSPRHRGETRRLIDRELVRLAPLPLARLRVAHAQEFVNAMLEAGRSVHSVRRARNILSAALNETIRRGELRPGANVAEFVRMPKIPKTAPKALPPAQVPDLLDAIEGQRLAPLIQVSIMLGLRPGEALGMRWADVNFEDGTVLVRHTSQRAEGKVEDRGTKTATERVLRMPDVVAALLRKHRAEQNKERLKAAKWAEEDRVFANRRGGAVYQPYVTRQIKAIIERANAKAVEAGREPMRHLSNYQLRHTGATLLRSLGVPVEDLKDFLGHTNIQTTLRYAEALDPARQENARRVDGFFRAAGAE